MLYVYEETTPTDIVKFQTTPSPRPQALSPLQLQPMVTFPTFQPPPHHIFTTPPPSPIYPPVVGFTDAQNQYNMICYPSQQQFFC